jgi:hypothetical protein
MSAIVLMMSSGCGDRSADVAREAANRQADQNLVIAKVQSDAATALSGMAREQARARQQALIVHKGLQAERAQLAGGWNELEAERRSIAGARRTESFLAALTTGGGSALVGLLALSFAWLVMFGLSRRDDSAELASELLVAELTVEEPLWLPRSAERDAGAARLPPPACGEELSPPERP